MGVNRANTDQFQLRMPPGLRERIKAYAEQHGRSMNTEIVRILEREFPEPETIDGVVGDLLDVVAVLDGGVTNDRIERVVFRVEDTIKGIVSGRIQGIDQRERQRIRHLWEEHEERRYKEAAAQQALDEGEEGTYALTGGTQKYGQSDLDDDEKPQGGR